MTHYGTDIRELAKETAEAVIAAAKQGHDSAYDIHIFLQQDGRHQEWENGTVANIPMYGVHCDRSYGGTEEAEEAVRENLPNALVILENNAEEAWSEIARENGYSPVDFALGVSLAVEEMI